MSDSSIDMIVCPLFETGPRNLRNSEGGVVELSDGRLLLAYMHFYTGATDWSAGDIRGKTSEDGGKTWSEPFLIEPNSARFNVGRLSLFRLPPHAPVGEDAELGHVHSGLLGHVYVEWNDGLNRRMFFKTSSDEGQTWSAPVQINDTGTLGSIAQCGDSALALSTGRILVPAYALFGQLCASFMYYSDDDGFTWARNSGEISVPLLEGERLFALSHFEEPVVAELRDGRLLCLGRTCLGQLYQSFSKDGGMTWSPARPSGLVSSYAPAALKTIPTTGDLLCVWNQATRQEMADGLGRMRVSCAISKDDGDSWTHFQNLDSLDDTTRVEPEDGTTDTVSQHYAVQARTALEEQGTQLAYPGEVTSRYPRWPGYIHNCYPSAAFTSTGNVVITYMASDYSIAGLPVGLKLVIRPIDWFYNA
ncbi:MAG: sialidase family protein [Lentisphaeria bacterium]|jgi:hypothetical protein|nr:sialidase family protein [Lentisphaeria bacterium]